MAVKTRSNHVGVTLRLARVTAGMTLDQVARRAQISVPYLSNAERGKVQPTAEWAYLVMDAIGQFLEEKAAA